MAKYAILIYEDEAGYAAGGPELYGKVMQDHGAFAEKAGAAIVGGEALQPTSTATTLRANGSGDVTVTDGAVRRDQGGPRRLLPDRGGGPGRGDRDREDLPRAPRRGRGAAR